MTGRFEYNPTWPRQIADLPQVAAATMAPARQVAAQVPGTTAIPGRTPASASWGASHVTGQPLWKEAKTGDLARALAASGAHASKGAGR